MKMVTSDASRVGKLYAARAFDECARQLSNAKCGKTI
jgi:hypothetical protein